MGTSTVLDFREVPDSNKTFKVNWVLEWCFKKFNGLAGWKFCCCDILLLTTKQKSNSHDPNKKKWQNGTVESSGLTSDWSLWLVVVWAIFKRLDPKERRQNPSKRSSDAYWRKDTQMKRSWALGEFLLKCSCCCDFTWSKGDRLYIYVNWMQLFWLKKKGNSS